MSMPEGLCTKCSATQYCEEHQPMTPPSDRQALIAALRGYAEYSGTLLETDAGLVALLRAAADALEAAEQERARAQKRAEHNWQCFTIELAEHRKAFDRAEAAESHVATLTAQLAQVREALGRTTAMCRAATTWTSDDIQGLRYHAMEAVRTGMKALTHPAPSTGETE